MSSKRYFLVVLALCKNEMHAVNEWLQHYRMEGVEHFVIIDNGSTDDTLLKLGAHLDVTLYIDRTPNAQVMLYNKYFTAWTPLADWVLVVDLDDFMFAKDSLSTLASVLRGIPRNVAQISVPRLIFGSNGHIDQPISIAQGFTRRQMLNGTAVPLQKSIVRTDALSSFDLYVHGLNAKYLLMDASLRLDSVLSLTEDTVETAVLQLNHYAVQSHSMFGKRGHETHDLSYYYINDYNDVEDLGLVRKRGFI